MEKALFRCSQKSDETADSYLARADVMWSELLAKGIALKDIQAYITLRGSLLTPEDKKRVLLDVDAASSGNLTIEKVSSAIRMLGAGFFHEITGGKRAKGKTYDSTALIADSHDADDNNVAFHVDGGDGNEVDDDLFETLVQDSAMEGDEDAALIQDFESATADLVQSDPDLASAYTVYTEARRRLSEKFRSRGFWPVSKGKSRGFVKGGKGKFSKVKRAIPHPGNRCNKGLWSPSVAYVTVLVTGKPNARLRMILPMPKHPEVVLPKHPHRLPVPVLSISKSMQLTPGI